MRLHESRLTDGPGAAAERFREVAGHLRTARPGPIPSNPSKILLPFFDYLQTCTDRDDRILYGWYSPEVYIVAGRAFAGDHRKFMAPFHSSSWEQARTIARLKQEHVPFVIIPSERRTSFEVAYSDVWRYLQERYVLMTRIPLDGRSTFDVFRDAAWTSDRVYGSTGWPCAAPRTAERARLNGTRYSAGVP